MKKLMERLQLVSRFLTTALLGGVAVVLPVGITIFFFNWIFTLISKIIAPLTRVLMAHSDLQQALAGLLAFVLFIAGCFLIGLVVRTRLGGWLHQLVDRRLLQIIPGYKLVKETVNQFVKTDGKSSPFTRVALAQLFDAPTRVTCFVTAEHEDGWVTVFMPTGPNPTSGNIYHLPAERIEKLPDASVEDTMRSIIGCGIGSETIFSGRRTPSENGL